MTAGEDGVSRPSPWNHKAIRVLHWQPGAPRLYCPLTTMQEEQEQVQPNCSKLCRIPSLSWGKETLCLLLLLALPPGKFVDDTRGSRNHPSEMSQSLLIAHQNLSQGNYKHPLPGDCPTLWYHIAAALLLSSSQAVNTEMNLLFSRYQFFYLFFISLHVLHHAIVFHLSLGWK